MKQRSMSTCASLVALWAAGTAATGFAADARAAEADAERPPPTARQPEAVHDLQSAVRQTAAVVEGVVTDIQYEYTDEDGPWTRVVLSDVRAHLGAAPQTLEIRHFGGRLPNGRMMVAAELPVFIKDKRYVTFLRNTAWNMSPVVGDLALRAETVEGREVLVNSDGLAVTRVGKRGVEFGRALFDPLPLDGTAPKALSNRLSAMPQAPLDAKAFVQAVAAEASTQRLSVGGRFYTRPAGEFKWRGNATSPTAGVRLPAAAPAATMPGGTAAEVDASRPN